MLCMLCVITVIFLLQHSTETMQCLGEAKSPSLCLGKSWRNSLCLHSSDALATREYYTALDHSHHNEMTPEDLSIKAISVLDHSRHRKMTTGDSDTKAISGYLGFSGDPLKNGLSDLSLKNSRKGLKISSESSTSFKMLPKSEEESKVKLKMTEAASPILKRDMSGPPSEYEESKAGEPEIICVGNIFTIACYRITFYSCSRYFVVCL